MVITRQFKSVDELQRLQRLACSVPDEVFIHSLDDVIMVDAKSFINLFTLDFYQTVRIVTTSDTVIRALQ